MTPDSWIASAAAFAVLGLIAYAVLAGADFGGGVWDLLASGPTKIPQRNAIKHAMGPVWEANHVWLIFVIVILFTCFPNGYAPLITALFIPLHLILLGIMLRGASFVFRNYTRTQKTLPGEHLHEPVWSSIFGASSIITPVLLGACFGSLTAGDIRFVNNQIVPQSTIPWLTPYALACGLLALSSCAFLAAVYLSAETAAQTRDAFRRRALLSGTTTAILAALVLLLARIHATWFYNRLLSLPALPVVIAGILLFALSAYAVFARHYRLARIFAAGEITLLLLGWALAHYPYLLYPDLTLATAAGNLPIIQFMVIIIPIALLIITPCLLLLRLFFTPPAKPAT